ncbi:MAG TPA: oxygenase MpaB family protein [Polyangiaceae bacterium]
MESRVEETKTGSSAGDLGARWPDALLDELRTKGDPPADRVIEVLFADRDVVEGRRLLRTLIENDQPPPEGLPPEVVAYLNSASPIAGKDAEVIEKGQELFAEHGPLMLMCLGCYSLPASYAAAKGVVVLHRTAYLEKRPTKRLFETTQMVIDVMTPGGLEAGGRGVRTIQKVRLMHAMVRHLIRNDRKQPWPAELGLPINQEDLAGTLTAFVWGTLDGLAKLGVHPSAEQKEQYLAAWRVVGRMMGLQEVLVPRDMAEAEALKQRIEDRQVAPSEEGRVLTRALLDLMERNSELPVLRQLPAALMRHFLPDPVPSYLGIPEHRLEILAVDALELLAKGEEWLMRESPAFERAARAFSVHFISWMVKVDLGGKSAPFVIPLELHRRWGLKGAEEPTFWARLWQWFGRALAGLFGKAQR